MLGAAGLGDIGQHFPDTDEAWRDADSMALLRTVVDWVRESGFVLENVDATVMLERHGRMKTIELSAPPVADPIEEPRIT